VNLKVNPDEPMGETISKGLGIYRTTKMLIIMYMRRFLYY